MKKKRYTDEQIGFVLRQAETGTPIFGPRDQRFSDLCVCHCVLYGKGVRFLRDR